MPVALSVSCLAWTTAWQERSDSSFPAVNFLGVLATNCIEGVEEVDLVVVHVIEGLDIPLRFKHRHDLSEMLVLPFPGVSDDASPSHRADLVTKSEHRVYVRLEMPPSVPAEHELIAVDVDMLFSDAMVCAARPAFEV